MTAKTEDAFKRAFAKNLWRELNARGWNQAELIRRAAPHFKLTRANISAYCSGTKVPGPARLKAIAKAFGIDPDDLLPAHKSSLKILSPVQVYDVGDGNARLQIDTVAPWPVAAEVVSLLKQDPGATNIMNPKGANDEGTDKRAGGGSVRGDHKNRPKMGSRGRS